MLTALALMTQCPADDPRTRAIAERFLTRSSYAAHRDTLGLANLTPSNLNPLVSGADDAAQRLGWTPLYILDAGFKGVSTFMM